MEFSEGFSCSFPHEAWIEVKSCPALDNVVATSFNCFSDELFCDVPFSDPFEKAFEAKCLTF